VIIYADHITGSIERAIKETQRRRGIQEAHNKKHGITPKTIIKAIKDITDQLQSDHKKAVGEQLKIDKLEFEKNPKALIKKKEAEMNEAVKILDFESAAILRDEIQELYDMLEGLEPVKPKIDKKKRLSGKKKDEGWGE
jgi:excinuclease ABC subunit B